MVFFEKAISFIKDAKEKQERVLVHCFAGISRSASVTIAFIMHEMRVSMLEAHDFVRERRVCICPNAGFVKQLLQFEDIVHGRVPRESTALDIAVVRFVAKNAVTEEDAAALLEKHDGSLTHAAMEIRWSLARAV